MDPQKYFNIDKNKSAPPINNELNSVIGEIMPIQVGKFRKSETETENANERIEATKRHMLAIEDFITPVEVKSVHSNELNNNNKIEFPSQINIPNNLSRTEIKNDPSRNQTLHFLTENNNESQPGRKNVVVNNFVEEKSSNNEEHTICLGDYENLVRGDALKYDKRSFWKFIIDYIFTDHCLLSLFKKSLINPYYIRGSFFVFLFEYAVCCECFIVY